ncbi:MAG TPA: cupin domain-containing protein [Candidatus Saccharimonadales bacterium]|nr:cupin domain-containing protein [Candidatus Saccharimonadales bacterium]
MANMTKKSFDQPDESNKPSGRITSDLIDMNGTKVYRVTAQPGWKWSEDLKSVTGTDSCPMDHLLYMISGQMTVKMDDGEELNFGPGDLTHIPAGHDGWGIGDEPTVWLEIPH